MAETVNMNYISIGRNFVGFKISQGDLVGLFEPFGKNVSYLSRSFLSDRIDIEDPLARSRYLMA